MKMVLWMATKWFLKDQTHRLISNNRVKRFRMNYLNLFNNQFIGIFRKLSSIWRKGDFDQWHGGRNCGNREGAENDARYFPGIVKSLKDSQKYCCRDGRVHNYEFRTTRKTAETWARIDYRLFIDEGFVEGVIADVTESKRQLLELETIECRTGSFIYHASNDLRSPPHYTLRDWSTFGIG